MNKNQLASTSPEAVARATSAYEVFNESIAAVTLAQLSMMAELTTHRDVTRRLMASQKVQNLLNDPLSAIPLPEMKSEWRKLVAGEPCDREEASAYDKIATSALENRFLGSVGLAGFYRDTMQAAVTMEFDRTIKRNSFPGPGDIDSRSEGLLLNLAESQVLFAVVDAVLTTLVQDDGQYVDYSAMLADKIAITTDIESLQKAIPAELIAA